MTPRSLAGVERYSLTRLYKGRSAELKDVRILEKVNAQRALSGCRSMSVDVVPTLCNESTLIAMVQTSKRRFSKSSDAFCIP